MSVVVLELQDFVGIDRIIGCSWGYQGYNKLKKHLPNHQILLNSSSSVESIVRR